MSLLTVRGQPDAPAQFYRMPRPRASGQGDIAEAIVGAATTALQIAAQERAAYLARKQAEQTARANAAMAAAAAQAAQQQQEQQRLAQAAQQEALRNSMAPAGSFAQGYAAPGGFVVPSWAPWVLLAAAGAFAASRALGR